MADSSTVCSMCGDIGFPDKLFRCIRCCSRFQHSYCTNYYSEEPSEAAAGVCDWCLSDERSGAAKHAFPSKKSTGAAGRPEHSAGDRARQTGDRDEGGGSRGKSGGSGSGSASSPKPVGRRYKLLKDVLC